MQKQYGSDPCSFHFEITPDDTTPLNPIPRAVYVVSSGNLVVKDPANTVITYAVTAGAIIPFRPYIITTATTATVIGWY